MGGTSMSEKCCGNCKHFKHEDLDGFGWCDKVDDETHCALHYDCHEDLNGWTEITPDNVDEINADLIVVTDGTYYKMANDWHASLSTLAEVGGYYCLVLPELKIE
jgi:hypothetical protein